MKEQLLDEIKGIRSAVERMALVFERMQKSDEEATRRLALAQDIEAHPPTTLHSTPPGEAPR